MASVLEVLEAVTFPGFPLTSARARDQRHVRMTVAAVQGLVDLPRRGGRDHRERRSQRRRDQGCRSVPRHQWLEVVAEGPVGEGDAGVTGGDICEAEVDARPCSRVDDVGAYGPAAVVVTDGSRHGGRGQGYVEVPWTRTGRPACVLSTRRRRCSRSRSPDRAG